MIKNILIAAFCVSWVVAAACFIFAIVCLVRVPFNTVEQSNAHGRSLNPFNVIFVSESLSMAGRKLRGKFVRSAIAGFVAILIGGGVGLVVMVIGRSN